MRIIIVSNRAPVNVTHSDSGYRYEASDGGLASGLRTYVERIINGGGSAKVIWIGWPGIAINDPKERETVKNEILEQFGVQSVFMTDEMVAKFYEGFCNKTIWPQFHYFTSFAVYEKEFWEQYILANRIFCDSILEIAQPGDVIWVHDYHLMLLPQLLRKKLPDATIGFFLHIPFPSYEVFRLLPSEWRKEILEGICGADLVGFHTHDYCIHFLQSVLRILGIDDEMGEFYYMNRLVRADTFPMGIDYNKYETASFSPEVKAERLKLDESLDSLKVILSIDRQDYSKGILNRLEGYAYFLENNPEWKKKVTLIMVLVPSRVAVEDYQTIKSKIDEGIGKINGKYGSVEWTPIIYQYRSLHFTELMALYTRSDVALITPLRDGMNLVAKEYIASRVSGKGVLILSEMAGAVEELDEAIVINPNNTEEIGIALSMALQMSEEEQKRKIEIMQKRISRYNVMKWASDFINTLDAVKKKQHRLGAKFLFGENRNRIIADYKKSASRIFFLDYDGTLIPYAPRPSEASPDKNLLNTLGRLAQLENTRVVLVSGRDKATMDNWFGGLPIDLAAEHGLYIKEQGSDWQLLKPARKTWKKKVFPVMMQFEEKLPGSFIEEKEFSLAFHYRKSDPEFAATRVKELMNYLVGLISSKDLQLLRGNKILEVRSAGVDKGIAAMHWLSKVRKRPRFILSIGDDITDEDLFRVMPKGAYSIKVGTHPSYAMFNLLTTHEVLDLLEEFK